MDLTIFKSSPKIVLSNERLNNIKCSLENAISETNRVTNGWATQLAKTKTAKYLITLDNVKSVFNGYMKKMLRHYLKDDVEVTRFLSWNKPSLLMDNNTLQIIELRFFPMRDSDHAFMPYIKCALETIDLKKLEVKPEDKKEQITTVELISFDSIKNIIF